MAEDQILIPPEWEEIPQTLEPGITMVVGATDTGKTTFSRWLYGTLSRLSPGIGFLDGDPGQSTLGPPATVTLVAQMRTGLTKWRRFVGATTPRGHMLPLVVSVARLVEAARAGGVESIIYDTTGMVDPHQGALALKLAKIDIIQPRTLISIRHGNELEPLLSALRACGRLRLIDLRPSSEVRPRSMIARQDNRARKFAAYFTGAAGQRIDFSRVPVLPAGMPQPEQLLAFEDAAGFTMGLGITLRIEDTETIVMTPVRDFSEINAVRLAGLRIDPETFRER